jgi:rfaE bifunctional protein nucleotidyltransferase chain/domain
MYKNVYVIGVFDLFHKGHVDFLKKAKALGERLIVAVNGDQMVADYKRRPFYSEHERLEIIRACKYVDDAFIIREYDNREVIKQYQVNAIVHGNDWERSSYLKQIRVSEDFLKEHNAELVLIPYSPGISTSQLIKRIKEN